MIKGKTKSGIKFEVDERIQNDWRYQKRLSKLITLSKKLEKDETDTEAIAEITNIIDQLEQLMFGGEAGAEAFEEVVANAHGGICDPSVFQTELMEIITATAKKSSSSQA